MTLEADITNYFFLKEMGCVKMALQRDTFISQVFSLRRLVDEVPSLKNFNLFF